MHYSYILFYSILFYYIILYYIILYYIMLYCARRPRAQAIADAEVREGDLESEIESRRLG